MDRSLKTNPTYASAWNQKGLALQELQRYEEAITCFDKSIEINPTYTDAWYSKGLALLTQ